MSIIPARLPIVAAPMAGGVSTPELVAAVGDAGGFGFLAAGYRSPLQLGVDIAKVRERGVEFGVNLFAPDHYSPDLVAIERYASTLEAEFERLDVEPGPLKLGDDDGWADKIDVLCEHPVAVVSCTFAPPDADSLRRLQRAGSAVLVTVTDLAEANAAVELGVDGLVVQGSAAGGHSAIWNQERWPLARDTAALVAEIRASVSVPVLGAGGIDGPDAVGAVLEAGADAAVVGTLFLRTSEAGTLTPHRAALAQAPAGSTALTRAYSGRPARGLRTEFMAAHESDAPAGYPAIHHLTAPLRRAATQAGDRDRIHLWAGTGHDRAREGSAAQTVAWLASE